jgi:GST-like protein
MIDLYTWSTPNGQKVSIMLEETGLAYEVHPVNLSKGEQHRPEYLALNPNNKIPTITDREGPGGKPLTLFESGAILLYLAEKAGKLLPAEPASRYRSIQWLMFQMGGVGPIFGQAHFFIHSAEEKVPLAIERFKKETRRLYGVMDRHLRDHEHLADEYTIADIATFPWVARHPRHQVALEEFPSVKRWYEAIASRPAVQRGMAVPKL